MIAAKSRTRRAKVTRARGRPREFEPDQALDRAMGVFWSKGYHAASIDDLTDAMKISRPSMYGTFVDKETLFLKSIDRYSSTVAAQPVVAFRRANTLDAAYAAFFEGTVHLTCSNQASRGCLIACCLADAAGSSEIMRLELVSRQKRTLDALARAIIEKSDALKPVAWELAAAVQMLMTGLSVEARSGLERTDMRMRSQAATGAMISLTNSLSAKTPNVRKRQAAAA
jgi:AcrR family transcriptional regulator